MNISIEIPENSLHSNKKLSQAVLNAVAFQLHQSGELSSQRAAKLAGVPHAQFLKKTGTEGDNAGKVSHPPLPLESLQGSRYLLRVLWALHQGENTSLTPMTASEIAKFVTAHSNITIQQTNTARFFRDCRDSGKFQEYWTTLEDGPSRRYELSEEGRELLAESLSSDD